MGNLHALGLEELTLLEQRQLVGGDGFIAKTLGFVVGAVAGGVMNIVDAASDFADGFAEGYAEATAN